MIDIQNTRGNYGKKIDKVGINNLIHPIRIQGKNNEIQNTVGNFSLSVSLAQELRGVNMSRLPIVLTELYEENFVFKNYREDLLYFLNEIKNKVEGEDSYISVCFDYFLYKKAPVSGFSGLMNYKCNFEGELKEDKYSYFLTVEVPITTLCPCSKAISISSAHNQRGYVTVRAELSENIEIEEFINIIEQAGSCDLYPILKREDEKYVTEKSYDNPRFVEDIVRIVADGLCEVDNVVSFNVKSVHEESIHAHNAFAEISYK
ncbi:GTP cyclohydrolase FolE2 [Clostridium cellulovorans]|uniref:GTP cyclohydrolase FolE2 n=1 Tax=Clostridium cellulovorans (strain ATCC 35296 / DSM 3052 / OCM 3 / 743B) TaxID=573061 RepID=D9SS47_CLOC7|nr:GTP cyclohydrolase FolE2 [Clostridium cellulovorans]ADL52494.1 GTP cyclohydrolase I [Clostridium cellulovorans 743B]